MLAVAENYPDLKTTTVMSLMDSVKGIEEEIARQRYTYNNISQEFNTLMDTIPSNIIGRLMGLISLNTCNLKKRSKLLRRLSSDG